MRRGIRARNVREARARIRPRDSGALQRKAFAPHLPHLKYSTKKLLLYAKPRSWQIDANIHVIPDCPIFTPMLRTDSRTQKPHPCELG